eukprot:SAG31_NODE_4370_length_3304_cov_2.644618_2_plen_112_part_00
MPATSCQTFVSAGCALASAAGRSLPGLATVLENLPMSVEVPGRHFHFFAFEIHLHFCCDNAKREFLNATSMCPLPTKMSEMEVARYQLAKTKSELSRMQDVSERNRREQQR